MTRILNTIRDFTLDVVLTAICLGGAIGAFCLVIYNSGDWWLPSNDWMSWVGLALKAYFTLFFAMMASTIYYMFALLITNEVVRICGLYSADKKRRKSGRVTPIHQEIVGWFIKLIGA